jgi:4-amino-4-deoxy-L-arabinose transferase-like glycosyltransferase
VALFYHTNYLVMVAPAISALAGIGVVALWQEYRKPGSRTLWTLPLCLLITAGVDAHILASYPSWARWLTPLVVGACVLAALSLATLHVLPARRLRLAAASAALAVLALMAPATAFAAYTMQHTQTGAILRAGPSASGVSGGLGAFGGPPGNASPGQGNTPPAPPSGMAGQSGGQGSFAPPGATSSSSRKGSPSLTGAFGRQNGGGPGGGQVSSTLITYLEKHRGSATYLVATPSSNEAAPIIIATGQPVISLGGFTGSDPILTTAKLASLARQGVVRYFLLGGGGQGGNNSITTWIQQHSRLITVGGTQLYEYTG